MDSHALTPGADRLVAAVQALSRARDVETIQTIVRTAARELTGADGATFVLRDDDKCFYVDEDAIEPLWKGQRFPLSACISGWAMLNRVHTVIPDIYADGRIPHDAYRPTFVKSLVMVPIRDEDPIGAIGNYWADHHEATDQEIALLQALANSTAIAMENVAVYQQLEQLVDERTRQLAAANAELATLSTVDELTGLLNRRGFLLLARQQLDALDRAKRDGAVVFLDVDGLKAVNDLAGHDAGDELLRLVATGLRTACRDTDIVARLGGDEFVTLLSETGGSIDDVVARIRASISATGLDATGSPPSVSLGVAFVRPGCGQSIEDLIVLADIAMYRDKHARTMAIG